MAAKTNNVNKKEDKISLEDKFQILDELVTELEKEDISLEDSFSLYKKGMELLKECNDEITTVEKKVLQLKDNGETDEFSE